MNNRRMFSNRIANSAKFLQMPADSQLLYFHMVLRADDDGVVESYPITKLLGVGSDNFKVLVAKRFIIQLNEDQVVVITDWTEHNKIRADRKKDSIYKGLLLKVCPDIKLIAAKERSDVKDNSKRVEMDSPLSVHCPHKLSKAKLSKAKLSKIERTPAQEMNFFLEDIEERMRIARAISEKSNFSYQQVFSELRNFAGYWSELTKSGKKQRWQLQKTFELRRRLGTWFKNAGKFNSNQKAKQLWNI